MSLLINLREDINKESKFSEFCSALWLSSINTWTDLQVFFSNLFLSLFFFGGKNLHEHIVSVYNIIVNIKGKMKQLYTVNWRWLDFIRDDKIDMVRWLFKKAKRSCKKAGLKRIGSIWPCLKGQTGQARPINSWQQFFFLLKFL